MKNFGKSIPSSSHRGRGFTLVELLVVVAVVAVLAGLSTVVLRNAMQKAKAVECLSTLRSLGTATMLYAQDNSNLFPRSFHSAGANREPGWAASIAPYLGVSESQMETAWADVFSEHYRSPVDPSTDPFIYSYALNVHFELDPNGDDYEGSPSVWRRLPQIPNPSATILMGQPKPVRFGDHLMCHQWSGVQAAEMH